MPRASARRTRFDRVRRGYDSAQVDAHLELLEAQVAELAFAAVAERERAELAEEQLRIAVAELHDQAAAPGKGSFGARAQRTLRLAERQADEIRARAVEEASIALAQVRVAAQAALDELRQVLLARVEAEGRRLDAALTEHGHQVAASMAAPRPRSIEPAREAERRGGDSSQTELLGSITQPTPRNPPGDILKGGRR